MLLIHEKSEIPISVIITNHDYENYLEECINSVLTQSTALHEIIVIDDRPKNNAAQEIVKRFKPLVQYHRVDFGHPLKSREYGFKQSKSQYVCFLDADDYLDKSYIQGATQSIIQQNVDLVYSDLYYFKDGGIGRTLLNHTNFHPAIPRKRIAQTNFLHVGCVVNRDVIIAADAFNQNGYFNGYHEDWAFWRKVLKTGCSFTKQPNYYYARKHGNNRSVKLDNLTYYEFRGLQYSTITFVGRTIKEISSNPWYIVAFANSVSHAYHWRKYAMLFGKYLHHESQTAYYPNKSKLDIINTAKSAITDYVFFYDEENVPDWGVVESMLSKLNHDVALVQHSNFEPFDCTLIVTEVFKDYYYSSPDLPTQFDKNEKIVIYDQHS